MIILIMGLSGSGWNIYETTTPNKWQEANLETAAKRRGRDGDYITHNGDYV